MTPGDPRLRSMTVEQKRQLLQRTMARRTDPAPAPSPGLWVRPMAARPHARRRLLCFPHGGGGATSYRAWPALLPPDFEPLAVHLPGRDSRTADPSPATLDEAAAEIADTLAAALDRPYVFYGHSLGGALAWL
ncbi:alpha/beta fold hydrolase, partial [Amaricoccus sp.]|uniref:thioesterase II family protein n=1 Tax=Amaricoccus sp. TaxID=1872485 RepID=UPI0026192359